MWDPVNGETRITSDPSTQHSPAISGDRIVWEDLRDGRDIYMWDPVNGETCLSTGPSFKQYADISGDWVVWQDDRNGQWDIYMWDPIDGETPLITDLSNQNSPAISGDRIVWHDNRNGQLDIYMVEISVTTEVGEILAAVGEFVADGSIANGGVAESLEALLSQAAAKLDRGNENAALNTLNAFINHVGAQSGKHIDPQAADALISMAQILIDSL
jgi:beta propeller repeat protein